MEPRKPEFTEEMRARLNQMCRMLMSDYRTKQDLMDTFGLGERQVRMMIQEIRQRVPVISTSGTNKGYKIATKSEEVSEVIATWRELWSRIEELQKAIKPLSEFYEKVKKENLSKELKK